MVPAAVGSIKRVPGWLKSLDLRTTGFRKGACQNPFYNPGLGSQRKRSLPISLVAFPYNPWYLHLTTRMRKEIIFAIVLGIVLGGIILYGLRLANEATKDLTKNLTTPTPPLINQTELTPTPNKETTIVISTPKNNSVANTNKITLTGTAPANTNLTLISEKAEDLIKTNEGGNFSQEIILISGENEISVSGIVNNELKTTQITIIYTTAEIKL
jgi:hypothetical protein